MRLAFVGTRGVPARYGGFETAVEEIGRRLSEAGHHVTVYCRSVQDGAPQPNTHLGMHLVHLPALRRKTLETLSHTALSVAHLSRYRAEVAILFNAANAPLLPALRAAHVPVATHVDGLEWQRAKWGGAGRRYYRSAEKLAVRWSDALIADAVGIQDYYRVEHNAATVLLSYGAPLRAASEVSQLVSQALQPDGYHLVVARFEPENNVHRIVEGYVRSAARLPLVVVGSAPYADAYSTRVHAAAGGDPRVRFLGSVWDQELLDALYVHCRTYVHGHSVGGTNPSLLRAAGAGAPVMALDVPFNREVVQEAGRYFGDEAGVAALVEQAETDGAGAHARGDAGRASVIQRYDWDDVARGYEDLCRRLAAGTALRPNGRGRRVETA